MSAAVRSFRRDAAPIKPCAAGIVARRLRTEQLGADTGRASMLLVRAASPSIDAQEVETRYLVLGSKQMSFCGAQLDECQGRVAGISLS